MRRLGASKGILFKYFNEGDPSGDFNFIERQTSNVTAVARGYLVNGRNGPETLKQKRLKQQFLSITSLIRVYVGRGIQVEVGCWLEYE